MLLCVPLLTDSLKSSWSYYDARDRFTNYPSFRSRMDEGNQPIHNASGSPKIARLQSSSYPCQARAEKQKVFNIPYPCIFCSNLMNLSQAMSRENSHQCAQYCSGQIFRDKLLVVSLHQLMLPA